MENNTSDTKSKAIQIIMGVVAFFGLIASILTTIMGQALLVPAAMNIIIYVAIGVYFLSSYKVPHGNHLKYILLFYSFTLLVFSLQAVNTHYILALLMGINAVLTAYISGRLIKINSNKKVICIIVIIFIANIIITEINPAFSVLVESADGTLGKFVYRIMPMSKAIQFIPLAYSYIHRFESHINAGKKFDAEKGIK